MIYTGGCHCGAVRFEVEAPEQFTCHECNCSICAKAGYLHLIVPSTRFELSSGTDQLAVYSFNSGVAKHYFCSVCGIKSFYVPRSNPDGYSVNVRCLDEPPSRLDIEPFDGKDWESHAHELAALSRDGD